MNFFINDAWADAAGSPRWVRTSSR